MCRYCDKYIYTKKGEAMCTVLLMGVQDVVHVKQSECTKV